MVSSVSGTIGGCALGVTRDDEIGPTLLLSVAISGASAGRNRADVDKRRDVGGGTGYGIVPGDALVIASFKGASFVPGALVLGGNASNLGGRPW